ncbi:hypothetical protein MRY87_05685 [bacterium]|nr:hypothetical protein [bacterium]
MNEPQPESSLPPRSVGVRSVRAKLLRRQFFALTVLLGTLLVTSFRGEQLFSVVCGSLVMMGVVLLFSLLGELLLHPEVVPAEKKVFFILLLPLKFGLLLVPFLLVQLIGRAALPFFALGLVVCMLPLLLPNLSQEDP